MSDIQIGDYVYFGDGTHRRFVGQVTVTPSKISFFYRLRSDTHFFLRRRSEIQKLTDEQAMMYLLEGNSK